MQMNKHWGYSANDKAWKSSTTLIRQLIDAASKGGNYLLNIGPDRTEPFRKPVWRYSMKPGDGWR